MVCPCTRDHAPAQKQLLAPKLNCAPPRRNDSIADMYDRDQMDTQFLLVREAHDRNDELLERIYIGHRFKNDTERLEKLFELYTKMTR
jgi:hypothetical protein